MQSARLKAGSTIASEISVAAQALRFGRKRDQGVKFLASGAGIDRFGCEARAFEEIRGASGGDERCGGVGYNDVTARTWLAGNDGAEEFRIERGIAAGDRGNRRAAEAKGFGR